MRRLFGWAAVGLGCAAALVASAGAEPTTQVRLHGDVQRPTTLTLPTLQAAPVVTQTVTFQSGNTPQTHTYLGASLWGTLSDAGIVVDPAVRNDILNKFVVQTGSDGYRVVTSLGEINPAFGNRPDILAYAERIGTTTAPLGVDGLVRTTSPGDLRGGRYVSNLADLDVRTATPAIGASGGGPSTAFTVRGDVAASRTFDMAALEALAPLLRTVNGITYTGFSLWDLLTSVVGVPSNPAVKNDLLGKYVVATGSDGYHVVFSLGELDPAFGGEPDFIAYLANGAPLGANGFARIVVPNDIARGRWVSNLTGLEIFSVAEPGSAALMFVGLLTIVALGRRRRGTPSIGA